MLDRRLMQTRQLIIDNVLQPFCKKTYMAGPAWELADILYGRYVVEDIGYWDDSVYWAVMPYLENVVLPHKLAVYEAGMMLAGNEEVARFANLSLDKQEWRDQLWLHDMSKLSGVEAYGYAFHDFKSMEKKADLNFDAAWLHHMNHNEHHPEYWMKRNREGEVAYVYMPRKFQLEMVADWIGAGKVYGGDLDAWLPGNIEKFQFHDKTAVELSDLLGLIGYKVMPGSVRGHLMFISINRPEGQLSF